MTNSNDSSDAIVEQTTSVLFPEDAQRRNSLVFVLNSSINYFVAPVFYVGVLPAAILPSLSVSDTIANLPESVYIWTSMLSVLIVWMWPSTRHLRRMLVINYACKGISGPARLDARDYIWHRACLRSVGQMKSESAASHGPKPHRRKC